MRMIVAARNGLANWKFVFIAVSWLLLQLSFAYSPAFFSAWGKKLWRYISFSSTCFCYYRKHPIDGNKICPLPSSACFQQHFMTDSLYLSTIKIWRNLKEHFYYLSSTKSMICQIDANHSSRWICFLFTSG